MPLLDDMGLTERTPPAFARHCRLAARGSFVSETAGERSEEEKRAGRSSPDTWRDLGTV